MIAGTSPVRARRKPETDPLWDSILAEVTDEARREPVLASFLHATILNHATLEAALSFHLANKLNTPTVPAMLIREIIEDAMAADPDIGQAVRADMRAVRDRDPACQHYSTPLLYFKGFQALQAYRVAHWLWGTGRESLALFLSNTVSVALSVDIHPAARFGRGIMIDHATGVVVGETAIVEDDVSMLQSVTLGGTGKDTGDRHPKVRSGVLLGAGAKVLGNVEIGTCAKVGAGSVVLTDVPAHCTVAGVPAKIVGDCCSRPSHDMDHRLQTE